MDRADGLALLATGGWRLVDPRPINAAHPETFELPSAAQREAIRPGQTVRSIFSLADLADPVRDGRGPYDDQGAPILVVTNERMWSWVESIDGDQMVCILQNEPYSTHSALTVGSRFVLPISHVIEVDAVPAVTMADHLAELTSVGLGPQPIEASAISILLSREPAIAPSQLDVCRRHSVKAHRPWPFSLAVVDASVGMNAGPIYGIRQRPIAEKQFCGWFLWTGDPELGNAAAMERITVRQASARSAAVMAHLALPPGWCFTLTVDAPPDVWFDPELAVE